MQSPKRVTANDPLPQPANAPASAPAPPDERDATIKRLERNVAEERQNSALLRDTVEGLRFKLEVLEKGYSKQLADARVRTENAERELGEQRARLAELGTGGEDTIKLLAETRAELARARAVREQPRTQVPSNDNRRTASRVAEPADEELIDGWLTINSLIADTSWLREGSAGGEENAHLRAQVRVEQEAPPEEMISPELVFSARDKDDES
jgi:hypothetical protein